MSKPTDSAVPHDDAVSDAYRDLPPREPTAALDARVRALVQAELASKAPAAPAEQDEADGHHLAEVIPLPPPRRNWTVPLAAAASFLGALTIGLWWFGGVFGQHEEKALLTFEETASEPAVVVAQAEKPASVAAAPVVSEQPASELPASAPTVLAQADTATQPAPPVAAKSEQAPIPAAPAAAPPAPSAAAPAAREAFSPPKAAEPAAAAPSADSAAGPSASSDGTALRKAAPTATGTLAAPMAGNQAQAEQGASAAAAKPARPAPTLESIRRLKRDAKESEARAEFHRWLLRHPGAVVPEDLRGLLESGASSPAP